MYAVSHRLFEKTANISNDNHNLPGKPVRHKFQFLAPEILCVILDVPIKPSITSIAAVEATAFPSVRNGILWSPIPRHRHFIHFSGGFFVEANIKTYGDCIRNGICTGMQPLQYADDTAGCHIRQHFGETDTHCRRKRIDQKRFLLQTGDKLTYTLLEPITLRMICQRKTEDKIKTLNGRGVIRIPEGCSARTNKAILSKPNPAHRIIVRNSSLFQNQPLKIAKSTSNRRELMHIELISTDERYNPTTRQSARETPWQFIITAFLGGMASVFVTMATCYCFHAKETRHSTKRSVDL